jgi:hypothetical protein
MAHEREEIIGQRLTPVPHHGQNPTIEDHRADLMFSLRARYKFR